MKMTGSHIVMECLKEQHTDTIFGFPGGTVIGLYDALYDYPDIRHILTCHEQHAAHAADGYARATGKTGVVLATSGPGATNLVTGIATAYMDSAPLVAITGNVDKSILGRDSFQEVDITGVTMPITKHNVIVKDISELAGAIRDAFFIAQSGRPGSVLVDITKDVTLAEYDYQPEKPRPLDPVDCFSERDIENAVRAVAEAKRPFVILGGGVISAGAEKQARDLVERLNAPFTMTLMGTGAIPQTHPNYTGMVGMHGTKASALCVSDCDLLIAVGTRFSERVTSDKNAFASNAKVLHIDVDSAEINKNVAADYEVVGNAKDVLDALLPRIAQKEDGEWLKRAQHWKRSYPLDRPTRNARYPKKVLQAMQASAPADTVFTTEVGQHQMWAAQFLCIERPRELITSGGLGTMGFGLGAAVGAAIGTGKQVVNIAGDGSFHMNFQEILTAVRNKLPIMVLVFKNNVLGMVRQWQTLFYDKRYSQTTLDYPTDYCMLAKALGAEAMDISEVRDLKGAFKDAFSCSGPIVVKCDIMEDENVLPMVPGGKSLDEIILDL